MNKTVIILLILILFTASTTALDVKSGKGLQVYVGGEKFFDVKPSGLVEVVSGELDLNNGNISNVDEINGNSVSSLGSDGYIGDSQSHTAGGSLDMNGNSVSGVDGLNGSCPSGYVWVPGSSKFGTMPGFCVMKYEAKNDGSGNPVSQPSNSPWVNIEQYNAKQECRSLGQGYHLVNEREWMTMAYQIANNPANWADGTIGSKVSNNGGLLSGNTGNSNSVSYDGADPESGTGRNSKAELELSNGNTVWDLSGNVWEWTSTRIYTHDGAHESPQQNEANGNENWNELSEITDWRGLSESRAPRASWNSAHGIGRIYLNGDDTSDGDNEDNPRSAVRRGGYWINAQDAGLFTVGLNGAPSSTRSIIGFRCSLTPVS